jgi:signal transduction histidine kinase
VTPTVTATELENTASDDANEIAWQAEILGREFPERVGLTFLGYALCMIYLPPLWVACLAAVNIGSEVINHHLSRNARLRLTRFGYRAQLALIAAAELAFTAAAGLVWMQDHPFAKAFAVGMTMSTLLHLSAVRSIHLPIGLTGLAAVALTVMTVNTIYWIGEGNPIGLTLSAASAFCVLAYTFIAMLSNNRLHRAMRAQEARATRADAAKSRFLAVLSHEMRTPLNAVLGMGHAALAETMAPLERERMAHLVAAARDLATILDDATDMSAIVDGRFRLRERPVDPRAELAATVCLFRQAAARQRSTLVLEIAEDLPRLLTLDPQRLRQCLGNLLANALKHAGEGEVRITATAAAGTGFTVEVADSGPGLSADEAEFVFEPFRRGRTGAQGTGLGLTICRALARQMGGDVTLVPTPEGGRGARFRLWLPALPAADAAAPAPAAAAANLRGRTVLVVDDIATNRLVAAMYLRPSEARVLEAGSGQMALEVLAEEAVDLVLLDLNMPGMDGVETLAAIRAPGGRNARVPVVAMTADATVAELPQMDGVLVKPLDPERLQAELARHLAPGWPAGQDQDGPPQSA